MNGPLPPGIAKLGPRARRKLGAAAWLEDGCFDENGRLVSNLATAMAALRSSPDVSTAFAYDEMLRAPVLTTHLPLVGKNAVDGDGDLPRPVRDTDVSRI